MKAIIVVFALVLAVAHAGVIGHISQSIIAPAIHAAYIQGPGTSTNILGPDGAHIAAVNPGGIVKTGLGAPAVAAAPLIVGHGHGILI